MKIAFVFDGVFADASRAKEDLAWRLFGKKYLKNSTNINSGNNFLTHDEYIVLKERVYETRENGLALELFDSALYCLGRLKNEGHQIFAVTLRSEAGQKIAQEWCDNLGAKLDFIAVENRKIEPEIFKDFDFFISKKESQLAPLVGIVSNLLIFLPHKTILNGATKPQFQLVSSWEFIYRKVLFLSQKTKK